MANEFYNPFQDTRNRSIFGMLPQKKKQPKLFEPYSFGQGEADTTEPKSVGFELPNQFRGQHADFDAAPEEQDEEDDVLKYFNKYQDIQSKMRAGEARSAYMQTLKNQPKVEDYAPSKMRRFGGAFVGAATGFNQGASAGVEAGRGFVEAPYNQAVKEWAAQAGGQKEAAKLEQEDFESQGKALEAAMTLGLNKQRLQKDWAAQKSTERLNQTRSQLYEEQIKHLNDPNYDKVSVAGGIMLIDSKGHNPPQFIKQTTVDELNANAANTSAVARQASAAAAGRQVGVGERRNELLRRGQDIEENQNILDRQQRGFLGTRINAANQKEIEERILQHLAQNKAYSDFINTDSPRYPYLNKGVDTSSIPYQMFKKEFDQLWKEAAELGGTGPQSGPPEASSRFKLTPIP